MKKTIFLLVLIISVLLCACGQKAPTWQEQYDMGLRYLSEGNYEEAIIAFTAAIEIDPKQAPAFVGRGDAYTGNAQMERDPNTEELSSAAEAGYRKALEDYLTAIELDETKAAVYQKAADTYMLLGDIESAIAILEQGIEATGNADLQNSLDAIKAASNYVIQWADATFERLIRTAMGKPTDDIHVSELDEIDRLQFLGDQYAFINHEDGDREWGFRICTGLSDTSFTLSAFFEIGNNEFTERGSISSIADVVHFRNLTSFWIIANHVSDISPLLNLEYLTYVNVWGNDISDLSVLEQLDIDEHTSQLNNEQFLKIGDVLPA